MIDLITDDDRTGFGIRTMLDVERIPYRRLERAEDFDARVLLVASADPSPSTLALAREVPTVVVGAPGALVSALFGVSARLASESAATMSLDDPIWPANVRVRAGRAGKSALRLPLAPIWVPEGPCGRVLASRRGADGRPAPAVVRQGSAWWCLVDLGAAFTNLLDERYRTISDDHGAPRPIPRAALWLYYRAPESIRRVVQRRAYERLRRALETGERTEYPVDAAGWLLLELAKSVVREAAGLLVRVARWPAPFGAAAALTHDLEPNRYAYTRGLARLLTHVERGRYPATLGVVARPAARHWGRATVEATASHDVVCHGLEHRGETVAEIGRAHV